MIMDEFFHVNMPAVHKDVKEFYERNGLGFCDANGMLDITVSVDGSWTHRGRNALHCASFIVEVFTGRPLDVIVTEKCKDCKECEKVGSLCPHGRFHGSIGDMEKHNALELFGRSKEL